MIRLLICEDSAEARSLLRTLLADHPEIEIVGEAADGQDALARTIELSPDVVDADGKLPLAGMAGAGAPTAPNELPDKPPAVVERAVAATEPAEADGQELAELYRLLDAPSGEALAVPFLEGGDVLGALLVA